MTEMKYAQLPGLDKPVSRIFYGTASQDMSLGKNVNTLLDGIFETGVNAFDTARGYGLSEKSLGRWMDERKMREKVVVLTKGCNVDIFGKNHVNEKIIRKELEKSLALLRTDYVDIYLLHRDDPNTPAGAFVEILNVLKREGKFKIFGVSNWTHQRIAEANRYAEEHGLEGLSVSSPNFGLADQVRDPWGGGCVTISGPRNADARAWYTKTQLPVLAYSSLGRGFFSGRIHSNDRKGAQKILDANAQKGYLCEENMERLRRTELLAAQLGVTVSQVAMAYVFHQEFNTFAIVSAREPGRMLSNIAAMGLPLTAEQCEWLDLRREEP
jgi:aryl-alcohol dehydrogenase-like predicted oxidoreductase